MAITQNCFSWPPARRPVGSACPFPARNSGWPDGPTRFEPRLGSRLGSGLGLLCGHPFRCGVCHRCCALARSLLMISFFTVSFFLAHLLLTRVEKPTRNICCRFSQRAPLEGFILWLCFSWTHFVATFSASISSRCEELGETIRQWKQTEIEE